VRSGRAGVHRLCGSLTGARTQPIIAAREVASSIVNLVKAVWTRLVEFVASILRVFGVTIGRPTHVPTQCGPSQPTPGCHPNPWPCGSDILVRALDATGALASYKECRDGPNTIVRDDRGFMGIDAAARLELRFPAAPTVTVRVVHFSNPGRIEAFEQGGALADTKTMAPTPAVEQHFTLNGFAIDRVVVTPASPTDETRVMELCH
jgi:hypothetical protein